MSSQHILLAGGLLLFLASLLYGVIYDGFFAAESHQAIVYHLDMALNMAAKGDLGMASAFAGKFGQESRLQEIQSRISLHLAMAAALTILPLFILEQLRVSEHLKRILALLMICGGGLLVSGDFLQAAGSLQAGFYAVMAGYAWMTAGLLGCCVYGLPALLRIPGSRKRRRGS